ncbi:MAG: hypothetical protein Q8M39_11055 [Sulfuricurvum sp.]|nr:hypothetical protein [Sulfuricurvum sp.]
MKFRRAMAMIELIFAIVIIAITVITIPVMINVAGELSKRMSIDDDVMTRLTSQMIDKFQARWGGEYTGVDTNESTPVYISEINTSADLRCLRTDGLHFWRLNPDSSVECNASQAPQEIPAASTADGGTASGDVAGGLEMLNAGTETLAVTSSTGESVDINATYNVRYVDSNVTIIGNTATAVWRLGSSGTITEHNGGSLNSPTHLKRVVVRFWNPNMQVDTTLSFFKSNIGSN